LKVAIVCDWLVGTGGAERVVYELHRLYPQAPIYTSQYNPSAKAWHGHDWFADADIRTGWLQKLPKGLRKFLPPLRAFYFSRLNLSGYDLVISSSGAEAKAVKTGPATKHICYMHSPTHYYWARYDEYLANPGFGKLDWLARIGLRLLAGPMRWWDKRAAKRPDYIVANSSHIQAMIKQYYGLDSTVIFPPVDTERFSGQSSEPRRGFVTAGRQTPYKRIDLAVQAFDKLDVPLLVLGNGPDNSRLRKLAGRRVTFITSPTDAEVAHYFKTSLAFILPGVDDFGIVAVEALAAGTPVIAFKGGGALDYVVPGQTGQFFYEQTADSLAEAVASFDSTIFKSDLITKSAVKFSVETFAANMRQFIASCMEK
jgi:glycosyltransferase involved in cell wall biosynthesis